jgi:hypothetical protein
MSRLLWVGVGAAGGIYAYRKGQRAWDTAKERGVAGNAAVVVNAASSLLAQMRAAEEAGTTISPGTARIIDITDDTLARRRSALRFPAGMDPTAPASAAVVEPIRPAARGRSRSSRWRATATLA